jgi:hypothetical protein
MTGPAGPATPAAPAGQETVMNGCYVYGVLPEPEADPELLTLSPVGNGDKDGIAYVRHGGLAAVVSRLRADRPLGTPDDLRRHARVLDTLAARGVPVLPFRFGTVLADEEAVAGAVLTEGHDAFAAALERLAGRAQFTLRAAYEQEVVLREVLADRPDIAELRGSVAAQPEEAAYYDRIRLGELVAEAVEARREADADEIVRRLEPLAVSSVTSRPAEEDGVADASFLVEDARRAEFEATAEDLARRSHGRIRLRLLGPLAPYDFVAEAMPPSVREER